MKCSSDHIVAGLVPVTLRYWLIVQDESGPVRSGPCSSLTTHSFSWVSLTLFPELYNVKTSRNEFPTSIVLTCMTDSTRTTEPLRSSLVQIL